MELASSRKTNREAEAGTGSTLPLDGNGCSTFENGKTTHVDDASGRDDGSERDEASGESGPQEDDPLGLFGRFLSLIVLAGMAVGVGIGQLFPSLPDTMEKATVAQVSIPIAILIWVMVYPMMLHIDWGSLKAVGKRPKPVIITTCINYLVQPFTMYGLARLFFEVFYRSVMTSDEADEYLAGAVILGGAPCTAMVFVWSYLVRGDASYTLMQVAVNNLVMLVAYVPTVGLLLEASAISIPWDTMAVSAALYVAVPLIAAIITRHVLNRRDPTLVPWLEEKLQYVAPVALILTLVFIFMFQGERVVDNIVHILLIAVPLTLQTIAVFCIAYGTCYFFQVPHRYAGPAALIATSNFFELAVAVAVSVFGLDSPAALATVVGVLTEVPLMLFLVWVANRTKHWFAFAEEKEQNEEKEDDESTATAERETQNGRARQGERREAEIV